MLHIDYPTVITETPDELHELEKRHRYTHVFQRVRMLRLLKSGECHNLGEATDALDECCQDQAHDSLILP